MERLNRNRICNPVPLCSGLVAELNLIASEALPLQEIRRTRAAGLRLDRNCVTPGRHDSRAAMRPTLLPAVKRRWSMDWLAPVAAAAVIAFQAVVVYQRG